MLGEYVGPGTGTEHGNTETSLRPSRVCVCLSTCVYAFVLHLEIPFPECKDGERLQSDR